MSCSILLLPLELLVIPIALPISIAKQISDQKVQNDQLNNIERIRNSTSYMNQTNVIKDAPTIFTDYSILFQTLDEYGANPFSTGNGNMKCSIDDCDIEFVFKNDQYHVRLNETNYHLVEKYLSDIYSTYRRNVQENTYNTVKKNLKEKNLNIEKEEILEDDSIVLTINV